MTSRYYQMIDGKLTQLVIEPTEIPDCPSVIGDTLDKPIKNLVNDKMYDSKSAYLKDVKRMGLEVVGNDLLSGKQRRVKDSLTEDVVLDRIQRAESIVNDPSKLRARRERDMETLHLRERLLSGN